MTVQSPTEQEFEETDDTAALDDADDVDGMKLLDSAAHLVRAEDVDPSDGNEAAPVKAARDLSRLEGIHDLDERIDVERAVEGSSSCHRPAGGTTIIIIVGPTDARAGIGAPSAAAQVTSRPNGPTCHLGAGHERTDDSTWHPTQPRGRVSGNLTLLGPRRATRDRFTPDCPAVDGVCPSARRYSATACPVS